jgi:hypothetical protein
VNQTFVNQTFVNQTFVNHFFFKTFFFGSQNFGSQKFVSYVKLKKFLFTYFHTSQKSREAVNRGSQITQALTFFSG